MQAGGSEILELLVGYVQEREHEVLDPPVGYMQAGEHEVVELLGAAGWICASTWNKKSGLRQLDTVKQGNMKS